MAGKGDCGTLAPAVLAMGCEGRPLALLHALVWPSVCVRIKHDGGMQQVFNKCLASTKSSSFSSELEESSEIIKSTLLSVCR